MTKTQTTTLARIAELSATAPLDVTCGGIKGVNRTALWSLETLGAIVVERTYEGEGIYRRLVKALATVA